MWDWIAKVLMRLIVATYAVCPAMSGDADLKHPSVRSTIHTVKIVQIPEHTYVYAFLRLCLVEDSVYFQRCGAV